MLQLCGLYVKTAVQCLKLLTRMIRMCCAPALGVSRFLMLSCGLVEMGQVSTGTTESQPWCNSLDLSMFGNQHSSPAWAAVSWLGHTNSSVNQEEQKASLTQVHSSHCLNDLIQGYADILECRVAGSQYLFKWIITFELNVHCIIYGFLLNYYLKQTLYFLGYILIILFKQLWLLNRLLFLLDQQRAKGIMKA